MAMNIDDVLARCDELRTLNFVGSEGVMTISHDSYDAIRAHIREQDACIKRVEREWYAANSNCARLESVLAAANTGADAMRAALLFIRDELREYMDMMPADAASRALMECAERGLRP